MLEYDNASDSLSDFKGVIKLNKDPRAEKLSKENLIMKMSRLRNTSWILGIIVYCGKDAKVMRNTDFAQQKENFALRIIHKFNLFMIFVVVLLSLVTFLLLSSTSSFLTPLCVITGNR